MRYFSRLVRLLSKHEQHYSNLYIRPSTKVDMDDGDIAELFHELGAEADDATASELKEQEESVFASVSNKTNNRAATRRLTVMAEMYTNFITSAKLWSCIGLASRPANLTGTQRHLQS